jgi:pimeloyl-ACP methyl ester carboxylesterase
MRFTLFYFVMLLTAAFASSGTWAQTSFIAVNGFEANNTLYDPRQPYTIELRTDLTVTDLIHQRQIPILVRYPAELVAAGAQLPVVVWAHGGGADPNGRNGSRAWSEVLVRSGYAVVHFSVLSRDAAASAQLLAELGMNSTQANQCQFSSVYVDRPRDVSAVIDALSNIGALVPELEGRLNLNQIVMAGHSFGAYTSRAVAGARLDLCLTPGVMPVSWPYHDVQFRDARPIVFLSLSPQGPDRFAFFERGTTEHSWTTLDRPDFMATGAGDFTPGEPAIDRLRSFALMTGPSKYKLYIDAADASHNVFNLNEPNAAAYYPWIVSPALAFLDAHVRGNAAAMAALQSGSVAVVSNGVASLEWK